MDYWYSLDLHEHASFEAFLESPVRPDGEIFLFTTKAKRVYWEVAFQDGDGFLFGNEGHGVPEAIHAWAGERRLTLPQFNSTLRSLNLSTAAGIAVYEGLRQLNDA